MTQDCYPNKCEKKMKLLSYFTRYMQENLINTGSHVTKELDKMSRIPYLSQWCRSSLGVLLQLNNGTIQLNFTDHTKVIVCPLMGAISYIDEDKSFSTFRFSSIVANGCTVALYDKMCYTHDKIVNVLDSK